MDFDLTREWDIRQAHRQVVKNFCAVVKNYFKTNCPHWDSMSLEELRKIAFYVFKAHVKKA